MAAQVQCRLLSHTQQPNHTQVLLLSLSLLYLLALAITLWLKSQKKKINIYHK